MELLEQRIARLEADLSIHKRRARACFAVMLACLAFPFAWAGTGQGEQVQAFIRTRGLEVVSREGNTVARISVDQSGGGWLSISDKKGDRVVNLFSEGAVTARSLSILQDTKFLARLGGEASGGVLSLYSPGAKMAAKLSVSAPALSSTPPRSAGAVANPLTGLAGGRLELRSLGTTG